MMRMRRTTGVGGMMRTEGIRGMGRMRNNKKGAVLNWVWFGFLAALIIVLYFTADLSILGAERGKWQTGFLELFTEAEKSLLVFDVGVEKQMQKSLLRLIEEGGFNEESPCGEFEGYNLWGPGCFPNLGEELVVRFDDDLKTLLTEEEFAKEVVRGQEIGVGDLAGFEYEIKFEEGKIKGKTENYFVFRLEEEGKYLESEVIRGCGDYSEKETCLGNDYSYGFGPCVWDNLMVFIDGPGGSGCVECPESCSLTVEEREEAGTKGYYISNYEIGEEKLFDLDPCGCASGGEEGAKGLYKVRPGFVLGSGYDFSSFDGVVEEAEELLFDCRNRKNLSGCYEEMRKEGWKLNDCVSELVEWDGRKVKFCVRLGEEIHWVEEASFKPNVLVDFEELGEYCRAVVGEKGKYLFALDFTPTKPFKVESVEGSVEGVLEGGGSYTIGFEEDELAESYKVYFTDYVQLEGLGGEAEELGDKIPPGSGFFWDSKEVGQSELVLVGEGKVSYSLSDEKLEEGGEYLVGVVVEKGGEESEIGNLVKIS